MKNLTNRTVEKLIDSLDDKYGRGLAIIGERIRQERILPFCKKHGLTFVSGMGSYGFTDRNGKTYIHEDIEYCSAAIAAELEMLAKEIITGHRIGLYVDDVRESDLE